MGLISKDISGWELHKIADGSLSCENPKLTASDVSKIDNIIRTEFAGRIKEDHVIVSYDNWSGVFIMHCPGKKTRESDKIIKDIYGFLIELER